MLNLEPTTPALVIMQELRMNFFNILMLIGLFQISCSTAGLLGNSLIAKVRQRTSSSTEISAETMKVVGNELRTIHLQFDKFAGDFVEFNCDNSAYKMIMFEFPYAALKWRHNGHILSIKPSRMVYNMGLLAIQNLEMMDGGTYTCAVEYAPNKQMPVAVFSLIVGAKTTEIAEGNTLQITCDGDDLLQLFPNSVQIWKLQRKLMSVKSRQSSKRNKQDLFKNVSKKHNGIWFCVIFDNSTKRAWKTARYNITILPPPNAIEKLYAYAVENKIRAGLVIAGVLIFFFVAVQTFISRAEKRDNDMERELEYIKKHFGIQKEVETTPKEEQPMLVMNEN
ncbi:hypothetical protein CHS0354_030600 [Potamilus streckersoni]|uniref:Ig-like domain-containing protein n=1 Tax=Potamilus streckersoni TaxID=2493646 RepID=A0AAE0SCQ4_9BIVA|nr:hypothetical protein CHS0354_030600 [Potamilus streckersoni]